MTLVCGDTYNITYTNAEGLSTERKISIEDRWESWGYEYIKAYCHLKKEVRTFRVDRIQRAEVPAQSPETQYAPVPPAASPAAAAPAEQRGKTAYKTGPHPLALTLSCLFILTALVTCIGGNMDNRSTRAAVAARSAPVKTAEWELQIAQRIQRYSLAAGFRSAALAGIYASADINYDNILSWQEIDSFQRQLKRKFRYKNNQTALTPEDFLNQGGGDCEDWALFTCGMLRFWGYKAYVGVVDGGGGGYSSHAIALFYKKTRPANSSFSWYHINDPQSYRSAALLPGYYLPIDYEYSGSFSNASRPDSPLRNVYIPEDIYNRYM